jgi:hypothetical protein
MPNRWSWIALGLGFYIAFALRSLPAAVAVPWLVPPEVQVVGLDGPVWRGSATLVSANSMALRNVEWDVHGWPLLTLRLVADVRAELSVGFVETRLAATADAVELGGTRLSTTLTALEPVLPPSAAGIRGSIRAQLERVRLEDGWPTVVVGEVRLAQLAAPPIMATNDQPQLLELGDYAVEFVDAGEGGIINAQFRDMGGGPLEVNGTLSLDRQRVYELAGSVMARPGAPRMLVDGVAFFAPEPGGSGKRSFLFTDVLRP